MSIRIRPILRLLSIGLPCLLGAFAGVLAQARETRTFPFSPGDTLVVQNDYGRVRVQGSDSNVAEIDIRRLAPTKDQLENIVVLPQKTGNKLFINSYFYDYKAESVYLDVLVPRTMNVVIWGANPAVELTALSGYVRVFTQTGLVTATDLTASSSLTTETGDILYRSRVQPVGDVRLESVKGKVRCHLATGLNLRGWLRAGAQLRWNNEIELQSGHLERQVGVGGPLFYAASQSGAVLVDLDLTQSDTQAVAMTLPPERRPRSYPTPQAEAPTQAPGSPETDTRTSPRPQQTQDPDRRGPAPVLRPSNGEPKQAPQGRSVPQAPSPEPMPGEEVIYTTNTDGTIDSGYSLQVNVNWTYLNVSVRDPRTNRSVPDLGLDDFVVYEDDQLQRIEKFESAEAPFSLLLLLDVSGSTKDYIDLIKDASVAFTRQINPIDQIAVATFNSRTRLIQDFTNNRQDVAESIDRIRSGGGTAFYDALEISIQNYMAGMEGRKAIVVFSDGEDNQLTGDHDSGSRTTFQELYRDIQEVDTIIYTIFLSNGRSFPSRRGSRRQPRGSVIDIIEDIVRGRTPSGPLSDRDTHEEARRQMQLIADQTGGRMYATYDIYDLRNVYSEIADDLRVQYTLAYNSTNLANDGRWREIRVKMNYRKDLAVRTRRGYYAKGSTSGRNP